VTPLHATNFEPRGKMTGLEAHRTVFRRGRYLTIPQVDPKFSSTAKPFVLGDFAVERLHAFGRKSWGDGRELCNRHFAFQIPRRRYAQPAAAIIPT
jgi:hypothetical protein